jgi:hypothetical protein
MCNSSEAMSGSPGATHGADTVSFDDEFMQYCYKVRLDFRATVFLQRSLDLRSSSKLAVSLRKILSWLLPSLHCTATIIYSLDKYSRVKGN